MTVAEFPFSDLVRHPTTVAAAADSNRRVLLHRRGAPDLELTRADALRSELSQAGSFARLLAGLLAHVDSEQTPRIVGEVLPWTKYLPEAGRIDLAAGLSAVIDDCVAIGTFAPLDVYLAQWRDTASIYADPDLRVLLKQPIDLPVGKPVPAP